ncbi:MAG: hypothetical protein ABI585_00350 [Betaproteobacteria bacterium]
MPRRIAPSLAASALVLWLPAASAIGAPSTDCGPPPDGAICGDGPWFAFASMTAYVVQGEARSRYEIVVGAGRDLKVSINENNPGYRGSAEALLIDGAVMATKGGEGLPNRGADLLGDPLLAAQEVSTLLQITLPKGPGTISKATPIRATGTRFIVAATPTMSSYYGPPWKVEGTIAPAGRDTYAFEFVLTFRVANPDGTVTTREHVHRYSGRASYPAKRPRIPDSTSLAGFAFDVPNGAGMQIGTLGEARRALGIAAPR